MDLVKTLKNRAGVVTGDDVLKVLNYARAHEFAIPAINAASSAVVVSALEAARSRHAPIMIETSQRDSLFFAGQDLDDKDFSATFRGSLGAAHFVRAVAPLYEIPVILHTDHCRREELAWLDAMLDADEDFFRLNGEALWSSHMVDFSAEEKEWNVSMCQHYARRMAPMKQWLEIEIGMVGEAHHAISGTVGLPESAFTQPADIWAVYQALQPISQFWSIAVAFGNVHGVYQPGSVKLRPQTLASCQNFVLKKMEENDIFIDSCIKNPIFLVMHGGSGSSNEELRESIKSGVVKININAATQFAYMVGIRDFILENNEYLATAVGSPNDPIAPNKTLYDTRSWIRKGQLSMSICVGKILDAMNTSGRL